MTLPAGTVRRIPRDSTSGLVPLYPASGRGDERQGLIRIPEALCFSKPHSKERREFTEIVKQNLDRWCAWLDKQGWVLNSVPKVSGPFDPPTKDTRSEAAVIDQGMKHYYATGFFQRAYPLYLPFDAAAWFRDEAIRYGEEPNAPAYLDSGDHRTVKNIINPERVDPMQFAAQRRERLGIKPDDWTQERLPEAAPEE